MAPPQPPRSTRAAGGEAQGRSTGLSHEVQHTGAAHGGSTRGQHTGAAHGGSTRERGKDVLVCRLDARRCRASGDRAIKHRVGECVGRRDDGSEEALGEPAHAPMARGRVLAPAKSAVADFAGISNWRRSQDDTPDTRRIHAVMS